MAQAEYPSTGSGCHIVTIPGQTISLKNSKQIVVTGKGKRRIIASEAYQSYAEAALWYLKGHSLIGHKWRYPLLLSFHFVRRDKRIFDHLNMGQGPMDLLVEAGIIAKDDMNHVIPADFSWEVDKRNPRCVVTIQELSK
jgi:hypothetical protein